MLPESLMKGLAALVIALGLAACGGGGDQASDQGDESAMADEMAADSGEGMAAAEDEGMEMAESAADMAAIAAAVAADNRPEEDRVRDAGRQPAAVLAFFGVEPGMRVVDLFSGGGYYSRILANLVGPEGSLVIHNSDRTPDDRRAALQEAWAGYDNVELVFADPATMDLADDSVDFALLGLLYHHWHFNMDEGEALPAATQARLANVLRFLKPGGTFGVVEHLAAAGATREASAALHRVPEQMAIDDITGAGFELAGTSDILKNHPEDDISLYWRENTPRGMTQRWVLKFSKPEMMEDEGTMEEDDMMEEDSSEEGM